MYIEATEGYYTADGTQHMRRGRFLILVQPKGWENRNMPMRALVRSVALRQCGHWMMGTARAFGHSIPISGAYGADGLTRDVPMEVYERAAAVPDALIEEWSTGGGWNSAGSEAESMRAFALTL